MADVDQDGITWIFKARIEKYDGADLERYGVLGAEGDACRTECGHLAKILEVPKNLLVTTGAQRVEDLLIGAGGNAYNNANSRIGVGDGNGSVPTPTTADTGLTAPTNRYYKKCDATYPSRSGTTLTWQSTYVLGVANFVWNEWIIDDNGSVGDGTTSGGNCLNHRGVGMGTKVSTAQWVAVMTGVVA